MTLRGFHTVPAVLFALASLCAASPANAQSTTRMAAYAQVGKTCVAETKRLCPSLDTATAQPRNQAICLKPYRSSLSLACRRAVMSAMP